MTPATLGHFQVQVQPLGWWKGPGEIIKCNLSNKVHLIMSLPVMAEKSRTSGRGCAPWQNLLGGRKEVAEQVEAL